MHPKQVSDPMEPDTLARQAGREIYGSRVGVLRRVELWKLGNLWGLNFPVGASKDFMLPFFQRLEADGKNPMCPPGANIGATGDLRTRDVKYEGSHVEKVVEEPDDFEKRLQAVPMSQLKKICKMRGIPQSVKDKKADLIARIMAASGGQSEQNITERSE